MDVMLNTKQMKSMKPSNSQKTADRQTHPESQLAMQVVKHIRRLVEAGKLKPGDKLPPERELARKLKISRASLRSGIGYLAATGVLNVRHGVGAFIADDPPVFAISSFNLIGALHGFQPWQMFETRLILESQLAALAAGRSRKEHQLALAGEVEKLFASLDRPAEFLVHDMNFHRILAQASGNPVLAAIMETLTLAFYRERNKTVEHAKDMREAAEMHKLILKAIRMRDAVKARTLMERHLTASMEAQSVEKHGRRKPSGR